MKGAIRVSHPRALNLNPDFGAIMERAREEYSNGASLSAEDVRRERGMS